MLRLICTAPFFRMWEGWVDDVYIIGLCRPTCICTRLVHGSVDAMMVSLNRWRSS